MFGKLNIFRVSTENVQEEAEATSSRQQQGAGGTGEGGGAWGEGVAGLKLEIL